MALLPVRTAVLTAGMGSPCDFWVCQPVWVVLVLIGPVVLPAGVGDVCIGAADIVVDSWLRGVGWHQLVLGDCVGHKGSQVWWYQGW